MRSATILSALGLIAVASAQTSTTCNPLEKSCPIDPALAQSRTFDLTSEKGLDGFTVSAGKPVFDSESGAALAVTKEKRSSTRIDSSFYMFFGTLSVVMKAAPGAGIVSSIVLLSDDLDELDWEFVGNQYSQVQTNYYGKGNATTYTRGMNITMDNPTEDYHNYTYNWQKDKTEWILDGNVVRTLLPEDAVNGTQYPQTPCAVHVGIWPAGDSANAAGTILWAGGEVDYSKGPYNMYVKSIEATDASTATSYKYGDTTGTWQSIQLEG